MRNSKQEIMCDFVCVVPFGGENQISDNLVSELDDNHKKTFREWIGALIDRLKKLFFNLVENSQYTRSKPNTKDHTDADYFDYFVKTVQIDGKVFDLIADVEKTYGGDGGYVYTLALTENKKIKASTTHGLTPVKGVVNASNKSISQGNDIVNISDEKISTGSASILSYTPADEQELTRMAQNGEITAEEYGRRMLEMKKLRVWIFLCYFSANQGGRTDTQDKPQEWKTKGNSKHFVTVALCCAIFYFNIKTKNTRSPVRTFVFLLTSKRNKVMSLKLKLKQYEP